MCILASNSSFYSTEVLSQEAPPEDVKGWRHTACQVALLVPKIAGSGAGWVIGAVMGTMLMPFAGTWLGAGFCSALGTLIGCVIALFIELLIRQCLLRDTQYSWKGLVIERGQEALLWAAGSLVGGCVFGPIFRGTAQISHNIFLRATLTGAAKGAGSVGGTTAARGVYTGAAKGYRSLVDTHFESNENLILSWANLKKDGKSGLWAGLAGQAAALKS